ncbi:MAG TPA: N-acetylglucosamine-6-phosphate deacetylase [Dehalococcoidia bacterium]|nr:N-acetylglucosamine-6-phosphate deacetylase [Dehalococcoidia bacterium]
MTRTAIINALVVLPDGMVPGGVLLDGDSIAALLPESQRPPDDAQIVDAGRRYLAPGFIDVHVHGGGGFRLMSDDPGQVPAYARWVARYGVTSFLVSTAGPDHASIVRRLRTVAPAIAPVEGGARPLGFHLEGPYINPARTGAFPPAWLRDPDVREYRELHDAAGGAIRQMTLAPELPGADALIDAVIASGAVAAIGHTDATYDEAMRAIDRGVTHATHVFNAMRPFSHRDPGVIAAVMTSDAVTAELIGDGAHVGFPAAELLVRAKGAGNVVLITDGMPLAGTPDGEGEWEGQRIRVEAGKAVRLADGTIVGGVITLDQAVRNAVQHLGVPLHDAVAMASANPARAIGLAGRYGAIAPGGAADLVLLDDRLRVTEVWVAGSPLAP